MYNMNVTLFYSIVTLYVPLPWQRHSQVRAFVKTTGAVAKCSGSRSTQSISP